MSSSKISEELAACRAGPFARAAAGLVRLYQLTLSPALVALNPACGCRFSPSCSHYARAALEEHGLPAGLWLTVRRLAKCGPWHPGGDDPVPPSLRRSPLTCRAVAPARSLVPPPASLS